MLLWCDAKLIAWHPYSLLEGVNNGVYKIVDQSIIVIWRDSERKNVGP